MTDADLYALCHERALAAGMDADDALYIYVRVKATLAEHRVRERG